MRFKIATTLVLLAVSAAAVQPVEAKAPRRAQEPYSMTDDNFYVVGPDPTLVGTNEWEARYDFPLRKGENAVSVTLVDESERPVGGVIRQYVVDFQTPGGEVTSGHAVTHIRFCGSTDGPVRIKKKLEVVIIVHEGICEDGTPSVPTNGDIVVDFYKR